MYLHTCELWQREKPWQGARKQLGLVDCHIHPVWFVVGPCLISRHRSCLSALVPGLPSHGGNHGEQATDTQWSQRLESMQEGVLTASKKLHHWEDHQKRKAWNKAMSSCSSLQLSFPHTPCVTNNKQSLIDWYKSCLSVCHSYKL